MVDLSLLTLSGRMEARIAESSIVIRAPKSTKSRVGGWSLRPEVGKTEKLAQSFEGPETDRDCRSGFRAVDGVCKRSDR